MQGYPYGAPPPQAVPFHFLPVPRPLPPGARSHRTDMPFLIWVVVLFGLVAFCAWYALAYAHYEDAQLGAALAGGAFLLLGVLALIPVTIRRSRRGRILAYGRAVPGTVVHVTNVKMVNQTIHKTIGTYQVIRIAFEDKLVTLTASPDDRTPPVFVEGPWAGVFQSPTPNGPRRVEMAKWYLQRR